MARSAKTTTTAAKPVPATRKTATRARPAPDPATPEPLPPAPSKAKAAKPVVRTIPAKAMPAHAPAPASAATTPTRVPPPSKGELRAQIEKLEVGNATLKAKSRETNRVAKAANKRIAELEAELAQLQEPAARQAVAPPVEKTARRGSRARSREIDPGDAVPPGVAVLDPEPLDAEAEAARDALEEKLSGK